MMTIKNYAILLVLLILYNCNNNNITEKSDYIAYLNSNPDVSNLHENVQFWDTKLQSHPDQFPYLVKRANFNTQLFDATGKITYLIKAEKDFTAAIEKSHRAIPSYLKNLAANFIAQHRFKEALELLKEAEASGEKLNGTKKMLFDVHLELGNDLLAETFLTQIQDTSDFDYLIRLSKWRDHIGDLDGAIYNMEKALQIAEASNIKSTKQWAYTNLADFYGHAGAIKKSYEHYLKALALDPNDAYAKKGIAWILFSHEKKAQDALYVLDHITSYHHAPDYELLKAEIAEFQSKTSLKENALNTYAEAVDNKAYGDMYNTYNIKLYAEDMNLTKKAIELAQKEVQNRPTPQSYDLLAWSYFKQGDMEMANNIIEKHVEGQTSEPEVLFHIAQVYKALGKTEKLKELRLELLGAIYELGPNMAPKINNL